MKITANQYARTLYELTENKSSQEVDKTVFNFTQIVRKNRQSKLFPKILESFNGIWNIKNKVAEAELISREKLDDETEKKIEEYIKRKYKVEKVLINRKIDENVVGGIIIRVGDDILDQSIKGQLRKLNKELTK
ncbi:MAG: ATP synthase F1 subunit delta [Candidatus Moraniibacteriota bacterium]